MYVRFCQGVIDKGKLIPAEKIWDNIKTPTKDYYVSVFKYNDKHYESFKQTGSIKGIKDVTTNTLLLDFDSKDDLELPKKDCLVAIQRLEDYGIKEDNIEVYFSGSKGFHVAVNLNRDLTPELAYSLAVNKYAKGLKTLDLSMYDASQIIRVPGTKNLKSNLFKIPLTVNQLRTYSIAEIKKLAENVDNITTEFAWEQETPGPEFYQVDEEKKQQTSQSLAIILPVDYTKKPKGWRNCKWSLANGQFESGQRHQALLVLAATCRGLGYDKDQTYYLCKSALKKQATLHIQGEFPKEELYKNIIEQSVFTDGWEGGQYSCQKPGWLETYCKSLGEHSCHDEKEEDPIVKVDNMFEQFKDYATNFDKNIVKTGIPKLDNNIMLCASTLNGLLGQPGAGKTSMALNYLRNTSLAGIHSTFFSLDMGSPIVTAKLVQKLTGMGFKEVLEMFKSDPIKTAQIVETLKREYKNVGFNFTSGLTVPDMKAAVQAQQERTGEGVKLVVVDYLENLSGPHSDPTANAGFNANQLKDMANELNTCVLLLLQTQKHSVPDISDPLRTLKGVKGSSLIEQSCSTILTLWREGYNPKHVDDDRYISFAVVKNRFGSLWEGDFGWQGVTGNICELASEEEADLADFRKRKKDAKAAEKAESGWG